jgi:hypothetical protein
MLDLPMYFVNVRVAGFESYDTVAFISKTGNSIVIIAGRELLDKKRRQFRLPNHPQSFSSVPPIEIESDS